MNSKLTKVERVFVPIDKGEFPDINDKIKLPNLLYTYEDLTIKSGYNVHRNYLQEQNNKYILSEEELTSIIDLAFDAGSVIDIDDDLENSKWWKIYENKKRTIHKTNTKCMKTAETHFKEYFKGPGYTNQDDLIQWGIAYATEVLKEALLIKTNL